MFTLMHARASPTVQRHDMLACDVKLQALFEK